MTIYYAYYNELGQITSVSNVPRTEGSMLELTEEVGLSFILGARSFHKYQVAAITTDGKTSMELVKLEEAAVVIPKVVIFDSVNKYTTTYDIILECDLLNKQWSLQLVNDTDVFLVDKTLVLFVVKDTNHDIIVRTIQIQADELVDKKVLYFPFLDESEMQIDDLTVLTRLVPDSYKLVITQ